MEMPVRIKEETNDPTKVETLDRIREIKGETADLIKVEISGTIKEPTETPIKAKAETADRIRETTAEIKDQIKVIKDLVKAEIRAKVVTVISNNY